MPYATAAAVANMDAVLTNIASFISGLTGWTVVQAPTTATLAPLSGGRDYIARKGACLVGLRSTTTGPSGNALFLYDGTGAWSSGPAHNLNGNSGLGVYTTTVSMAAGITIRGFQGVVGPFPNLFLFSNTAHDYVHVVLQISSASYRHMAFGNLTQYGNWTDTSLGAYFSGTYWSQSDNGGGFPISVPGANLHGAFFDNQHCLSGEQVDWTVSYDTGRGLGIKWISPSGHVVSFAGSGVGRTAGYASARGGFGSMPKRIPISLFTGLIPMGPVVVLSVNFDTSPITGCVIGEIPDIRQINMTNLTGGQEFTIGSDTWKVFPMAAKNGAVHFDSSGVAGFAYKKIP